MRADSATRVLVDLGRLVRDARLLSRSTQRELERRTGISQSRISRIERGRCFTVQVAEIDRLFVATGVRYRIDATLPANTHFVHDAVHIRCAASVQRRLEADGWIVRREVEIGDGRSRGWIDLLAFHPEARVLLVIEIKTELRDLGAIERSLNWYVREGHRVAAAYGWQPRFASSALIVLATGANDDAIRANRAAVDVAFPGRALDLRRIVSGDPSASTRSMAMIDPRSRRRVWLMPTVVDGRRSPPPYVDYIDAVRRLERPRS